MKHIGGLVSATQALRQIFLAPRVTPRTQFLRYSPIQTSLQLNIPISRFYHRVADKHDSPGNQANVNEQIQATYIQIANDDNQLGPPEKLRDVLRSLDRANDLLLQVSPTLTDRPTICKIENRIALRQREREQAKAARANKVSVKQVELNWAIDAHDLAHRLKQIVNFLGKGRRVEIVLSQKKRKRAPTKEEIEHVMTQVLQATKEANAMQVKPMEGEPGKHVVWIVQKKDD
ncbi:translation initiation factor IF-3, C-terminal domain-containing protein [Aspergillus californicus]